MAYDLPGKDKKDNIPPQDASSAAKPAQSETAPAGGPTNSIGAYGQNQAIKNPSLEKELALEDKPWNEDPKKRAAIVFASRTFAALAFVYGGKLGFHWMEGYDASKSWLQQKTLSGKSQVNPVTFYAKAVDICLGRPIRAAVHSITKLVTGSEEKALEAGIRAVHFRPTWLKKPGYMHDPQGIKFSNKPGSTWEHAWGRTLGEEAAMLGTDFYCYSVANGMVQDAIQLFDPNVKKPWTDKGGHTSVDEAAKNFGKSAFRYLTYNGGEDLAVSALTYPYMLRAIRYGISKMRPGFEYASDAGLYSGGFILGGNPGTPGRPNQNFRPTIASDFRPWNALDFQARFMVYNGALNPFGTTHYQEVYNHIANRLAGRPSSLYGPSNTGEHRGFFGTITHLAKWSLRNAIKATFFMTPTVPFFWAGRATGMMHEGLFIHPEAGMMTFQDSKGKWNPLRINDINEGKLEKKYGLTTDRATPVWLSQRDHNASELTPREHAFIRTGPFTKTHYYQGHARTLANPSAWPETIDRPGWNLEPFHPTRMGKSWAGKAADWLGWAQNKTGEGIDHVMNNHDVAHRWSRAIWSYPSYFVAKDYFKRNVDTHITDMALERAIDGLFSLNPGEFKAGLGETKRALLHQPFADPARQAEAERRMKLANRSANDELTMDTEQGRDAMQQSPKRWQDYIVSSKPVEKSPVPAAGGDGASLEDTYKIAKRGTHAEAAPAPSEKRAEQEEMKKFLREADTPTMH